MSDGSLDHALRLLCPGILGHRCHLELVRPRDHLVLKQAMTPGCRATVISCPQPFSAVVGSGSHR